MSKNLTKSELVDRIKAKKDNLSKTDIGDVYTLIFQDIIPNYLKEQAKKPKEERGKFQVMGILTAEVKDRSARKGRNPRTGEEIEIPARKAVSISTGKTLKEDVKNC